MISRQHEIAGFTWLKCILPVFVILIHYREIWTLALAMPAESYRPSWQDVLFMNVAALAVPLFFLISLYLYVNKRQLNYMGGGYLLKRIGILYGIFICWRVIYAFFGIGTLYNGKRGLVRNIYHWIFGGGDTALYFLQNLVVLIILEEILLQILSKLSGKTAKRCVWGLFVGTCMLIVITYLLPYPGNVEALRHFSPIAFFPYVPLAWLLNEYKEQWLYKIDIGLFILLLFCAFVEWQVLPSILYLKNGYSLAMPSYARISSVLISAVVMHEALRIPSSANWARILASLSLYVYCFHQIFISCTQRMTNVTLRLAVVLLATYGSSFLLVKAKKLFLKKKEESKKAIFS